MNTVTDRLTADKLEATPIFGGRATFITIPPNLRSKNKDTTHILRLIMVVNGFYVVVKIFSMESMLSKA